MPSYWIGLVLFEKMPLRGANVGKMLFRDLSVLSENEMICFHNRSQIAGKKERERER